MAAVEKMADELVRAAEALHLHGPAYQDADEGAKHAFVDGGFFVYMVTPLRGTGHHLADHSRSGPGRLTSPHRSSAERSNSVWTKWSGSVGR
ncbi:hypothetical protein ACGFY9_02360 [Streptomyces sp. NPDC048504]|uniref:hypothetical protein n=1 Tax=Streptomyces sp. NPDC048504 TaxID=3365559 RepID=UPI00370FD0F9